MSFKNAWYNNCLIWETGIPYLYLRTTETSRILIGGKDSPASDPVKRDAALSRKGKELEKSFQKLFPSIPFKTDFKWAGNFAATRDGLPYIGIIRDYPNTYYALGYGGNGIIFGLLAAQIITDMIRDKPNRNAALFSFNR